MSNQNAAIAFAHEILDRVENFLGTLEKYDRTGMLERWPLDFVSNAGDGLEQLILHIQRPEAGTDKEILAIARSVIQDYKSLLFSDGEPFTNPVLEKKLKAALPVIRELRGQRPAIVARVDELRRGLDASLVPTIDTPFVSIRTLREQKLIVSLSRLGAVSERTRRPLADVVAGIGNGADPNSYKHTCRKLSVNGIISSKHGRGGGVWLTEAGQSLA